MTERATAADIDAYIAAFAPAVQSILQKIRSTIRKAAPEAEETISYQMPAFTLRGGILIYFAAFNKHIGLYPPVRGDKTLTREAAPYAGEKGNLRFPLDALIPYALITKLVKSRVQQHAARTRPTRGKKKR